MVRARCATLPRNCVESDTYHSRAILRYVTSIRAHWRAKRETLSANEWRPRRPWILVNRSYLDSICMEVSVPIQILSRLSKFTKVGSIGLYPNRMYINRGNHETREMNRTYGFEGEAKHKHGEQTYKLFAHVFTASKSLPSTAATMEHLTIHFPFSASRNACTGYKEAVWSLVQRNPIARRQETVLCRAWRLVQ